MNGARSSQDERKIERFAYRATALRVLLGATAVGALMAAAVAGCGGSYQATTTETVTRAEPVTEAERSQHDELVAQGDAAFARRGEIDQLRAAIAAWTQATEIDPSDHVTWAKLSRAHYFLADGHLRFDESAAEEMTSEFQAGIQAGDRALAALSPDYAQRINAGTPVAEALRLLDARAVPALYWRAAALGKWARADGFATLLNYKDEIRAEMSRCMELDRYYYYAGPDRYFGAFFAIAPTYAGGDLARSRQHFEESIRRSPNYFGTRVLYAENYAVKAQNRQLFEEQLRLVIDGDPNVEPEVVAENTAEQRKARELMDRIDELFE